MVKIATPISHLFDSGKNAHKIMRHSDCLECRDMSYLTTFPKQELFHSEIQPIHELDDKDFRYLEKIAELKPKLRLVSFHVASSCRYPDIVDGMYQLGGVRYTRKAMLKNAEKNIVAIKSIFGNSVQIAVENNNYYPTEAYQFVTDADFLKELVCVNEIRFLYDIAHARVTAHNAGLDYRVYRVGLPLEQTIQVHICRHSFDAKACARDVHEAPDDEVWKEVRNLLTFTAGIEYLSVEYYDAVGELVDCLKKAKEIVNGLSGSTI